MTTSTRPLEQMLAAVRQDGSGAAGLCQLLQPHLECMVRRVLRQGAKGAAKGGASNAFEEKIQHAATILATEHGPDAVTTQRVAQFVCRGIVARLGGGHDAFGQDAFGQDAFGPCDTFMESPRAWELETAAV